MATITTSLTFAILAVTCYCQQLCPLSNGIVELSARGLTYANRSTFETVYNCIDFTSTITGLNLSYNNITVIEENSFGLFYELQILNLSRNNIYSVHKNAFSSLKNLLQLDLSFNKLTRLEAGLLDLVKLESVWFNNNNISEVDPGIVSDVNVGLLYFNMNNNSLRHFDPWPYKTYQSQNRRVDREFYLQHNKIENFTNYMNWTYNIKFPYEVYVYLQFNEIKTVSTDILRQYEPNIKVDNVFAAFLTYQINISHNPFLCDCQMYDLASRVRDGILKYVQIEAYRYRCAEPALASDWDVLHDLSLEALVCNITDTCPMGCFCQDRPHNDTFFIDCTNAGLTEMPAVIPEHDRSKIEMLLDENKITRIRNTSYISKLYSLSAAGNRIERLDGDLLHYLFKQNTQRLNLKNNKIVSLPSTIRSFKYSSVTLGGNPLKCDCESLWWADWMKIDLGNGDGSLTCEAENGVHKIIDLTWDLLECTNKILYIILACLGVILLLLLILIIVVKRCPYETNVIIHKLSFGYLRGKKYEVDADELKEVDIYAVFDDRCEDVIGWFRWFTKKLNKKKPIYSVLNPARFMEPGSAYETMTKWIGRSKRVLVILSEKIFENEWRVEEIVEAERRWVEAAAHKNAQRGRPNQCVVDISEVEDNGRLWNEFGDTSWHNEDDKYGVNSPNIIYILFNNNNTEQTDTDTNLLNRNKSPRVNAAKLPKWQERLRQEPWKSRLQGKVVLSPDDRLFWSKLRYELPPTGSGRGDGNFMPFTRDDTGSPDDHMPQILLDNDAGIPNVRHDEITKRYSQNTDVKLICCKSNKDQNMTKEIQKNSNNIKQNSARVPKSEISAKICNTNSLKPLGALCQHENRNKNRKKESPLSDIITDEIPDNDDSQSQMFDGSDALPGVVSVSSIYPRVGSSAARDISNNWVERSNVNLKHSASIDTPVTRPSNTKKLINLNIR